MPAARSIRARVRTEMTEEIKAVARRHLAAEGANLSLRAVARDMGMVSSAVYRYFASRDDLLTALILDGYNILGEVAEQAAAGAGTPLKKWLETCHAIRDWALGQPAEYALLFGSPVPGYAAPQETAIAASRTPLVLVRLLAELIKEPADLPKAVHPDMKRAQEALGVPLPPRVMAWASVCWIHLFGAISFELFGQLDNVVEARREYFDYQMRALVA